MADLVRVLTSDLKLVVVGVGAVALFGGTATTVSLVDESTPTKAPATDKADKTPKPEKSKAPKTEDAETEDQDEAGGSRPTDTHGYCVSQAVAKAHAAGKTGQDIAAAAHSCPKPGGAQKAAEKAAKKAGKSAQAPGRSK
jgi:hypothetical protein